SSHAHRATRFHAICFRVAGKRKVNRLKSFAMQEFHLGRHGTMTRPNDKEKVKKFYDLVSVHFHDLWGEHLHHGYWIRGDEPKEIPQTQLIELLAQIANLRAGKAILA